ncbi:putative B3 domain-containing protein Os03g0621600 [Cryptomeria japonica]|uniref:putative B3 domain-containing protein Os03g0621600 n=1 Tax=Cryptomeria japonica TaxID=3369 RepID=UPI0027DA0099|nr:putative B3 domain-containing protein Os03g0621600 [Cryptomeria japonica]XP_057839614.2 putative B3 domain-containing protein Os03g0621600 [Cryptomeria japonica]
MEDEETGELFIPCRVCSHKCFNKHGKYHDKQCFDGSACFFKVMLGDFAERLRLPPAFVSQFITDQHEHMVLQGPNGQEWEVELLGSNNKLEFRHGWERFVNFHGLQLGDFVVFKYISKYYFKVQMFGRSGCVKNTCALHIEKTKIGLDKRRPSTKMCSLNQPMSNNLLTYLVYDDKNNDEAEAVAENQRRKRKSFCLGHASKNPGHGFSSQNHMTVGPAAPFESDNKKVNLLGDYSSKNPGHFSSSQKQMTMKLVSSFKSDKPFCLMVIKSWNVNKPNMLRFPIIYKNPLQLPRVNAEIALLDGDCKEWKVQCIIKERRPTLSGGWKCFTQDNNIKEGDTCIFEQLDNNKKKFMFRVHIFPDVKKAHLQKDQEDG